MRVTAAYVKKSCSQTEQLDPEVQGGSNMTGTDLYANKPH